MTNGSGKEDIITLSVPSMPEHLKLIRKVATSVTGAVAALDGEAGRVVLALDEACANIIKYSCGGPDPDLTIEVTFTVTDDSLKIRLCDFGKCGKGFNLEDNRKEKDPNAPTPGGYGLNILKTVMDSVEYSCRVEGGNVLTMEKKWG